jgi:hypothetical protein
VGCVLCGSLDCPRLPVKLRHYPAAVSVDVRSVDATFRVRPYPTQGAAIRRGRRTKIRGETTGSVAGRRGHAVPPRVRRRPRRQPGRSRGAVAAAGAVRFTLHGVGCASRVGPEAPRAPAPTRPVASATRGRPPADIDRDLTATVLVRQIKDIPQRLR